MKLRIQALVIPILIGTVFAYGIAASVNVFYSTFFLPEEASHHSHSGHHSYCGFVYESPDYLCVHSLPMLDTYEVPVVEPGNRVNPVVSINSDPIPASVFNFYRFRAPPRYGKS